MPGGIILTIMCCLGEVVMNKITSLLIGGAIAAVALVKFGGVEIVIEREAPTKKDTTWQDWYFNHNILKLY